MGQSTHPVTVRYGVSQLWDFTWLGGEHQLHYPYTIKLFRFFSKFIQTFFLYQLYVRTSIFFFADILNWRNVFIKDYLLLNSYTIRRSNRLGAIYYFSKAAVTKQLHYKKVNSTTTVRYSQKRPIRDHNTRVFDITRKARLLRAISTFKRYITPAYYYQSRYCHLLENSQITGKSRKRRHFFFKKVNRRFLFSKSSAIVSGKVYLFRYKTWVLFLWGYLLTSSHSKFKNRNAIKIKKYSYFHHQNAKLRTPIRICYFNKKRLVTRLKLLVRGGELLSFNKKICFLF